MGSYSIKDVSLVNIIDKAEKDLQELKGRQFVGRRVLATKLSKASTRVSSTEYSAPGLVNGQPGMIPVGQSIYRRVTFTADNQLNPWGRLILQFYDAANNRKINPDDPRIYYFTFYVKPVDSKQLEWNVDIRGPLTPAFYCDFIVAATDSGTVESVPTNSGG